MNEFINSVGTGSNKQRSYNGDYMERGKKGEEIVIEFIKNMPEVLDVKDWRELKPTQEVDVDISIKTADGLITLAEIKSDSYLGKTPNVLYEILRINHTCDPDFSTVLGWSARTPARYILFYASSVNKIYRFNTIGYRRAYQKYTRDKRKYSQLSFVETDEIKSTLNVLIPIEYFKGCYEIYDLNNTELF